MKKAAMFKAREMRTEGRSMREIAEKLDVAKSSVSLWVRDIPLSTAAKRRIDSLYTEGQKAAQRAHRRKTELKVKAADVFAADSLKDLSNTLSVRRLVSAMTYWCEGSKIHGGQARFIFCNSDPALVGTFMRLLRSSFKIDESKFRPVIHIHSYHDEMRQLQFWSKVTNIPIEQFGKTYTKANSGITIRSGYQGCVQVRYYDAALLRQMLAIAERYMAHINGSIVQR